MNGKFGLSKYNEWIVVFLIMFVALAIRLILFQNTDHLDDETIFRTTDSYNHVLNPHRLLLGPGVGGGSGAGGQNGYYFVNSILMYFVDRPILVSRLSSLLFGILTFIPYYLLVRSVFSWAITVGSAVILSLYCLHVQLSVVPMAQCGTIFFLCYSAYFFYRYLYGNDRSPGGSKVYLLASIISTLLATSFRIEAWIFIFIYPWLLVKRRNWRHAFLYLILSSIYVTILLYSCHAHLDDPFQFLKINFFNTWDGGSLTLDFGAFGFWLKVMFKTFSVPLSCLGILGMALSYKKQEQRLFLLGFLGIFFGLTIRQIVYGYVPFHRYSSLFGIFFIPYIFVGVEKICKTFLKMRYNTILLMFVMPCICIYYTIFSFAYLKTEMPNMRWSPLVLELQSWMEDNVQSRDMYFFSFGSLEYTPGIAKSKSIYKDSGANVLQNVLDEEAFAQVKNLFEECHLESVFLRKRGDFDAEIDQTNRIIFILDRSDFDTLRKHYPLLFQRLKKGSTNFFYPCILYL